MKKRITQTDRERDLETRLKAIVLEKNMAIENLTREQVTQAFMQAIQCGDITRLVVASSDKQSVVYIPYAREQELMGRLKAIAEIIEAVDNRCLAVDGPVRPTLEEIRPTELAKIYKLAKT